MYRALYFHVKWWTGNQSFKNNVYTYGTRQDKNFFYLPLNCLCNKAVFYKSFWRIGRKIKRKLKESFVFHFWRKCRFKSTKRCRKCEKYFNPKKRKTNFKKILTYLKHFERNRCILSTWPSLTSVLLLSAKKYRVSRHYDLYIEQNMVIHSWEPTL